MLAGHGIISVDRLDAHRRVALIVFGFTSVWLALRWSIGLPVPLPGTAVAGIVVPLYGLAILRKWREPGMWMLACVMFVGATGFLFLIHTFPRKYSILTVVDVVLQGLLAAWGLQLTVSVIVQNFRLSKAAGELLGGDLFGGRRGEAPRMKFMLPSAAGNPGQIPLSVRKFRRFHRGREMRGFPQIAEFLRFGDAQPAVVMSLSPLLVAAYTDEIDCVAMLRFAEVPEAARGLRVGARLVSVNVYSISGEPAPDLTPGPRSLKRYPNFQPLIADFLTDDARALETRKGTITEAEWARATELGAQWLRAKRGLARSGRPLLSDRPAAPIHTL